MAGIVISTCDLLFYMIRLTCSKRHIIILQWLPLRDPVLMSSRLTNPTLLGARYDYFDIVSCQKLRQAILYKWHYISSISIIGKADHASAVPGRDLQGFKVISL